MEDVKEEKKKDSQSSQESLKIEDTKKDIFAYSPSLSKASHPIDHKGMNKDLVVVRSNRKTARGTG